MFDCFKKKDQGCMPCYKPRTDQEKIEDLKKQKKEVIKELYDQSPDYRIVFDPNPWAQRDDYQVQNKLKNFDMSYTGFYNVLKYYKTRKEAEQGMKLIKEEMDKN